MAPPTRLAVGLVVLLVGRAAAAQDVTCDPGDTEVRALAFRGNQTFRDDQLEIGIETTQSTWWRRTFRFIGRAYCLDSVAVATDSIRLQSFYQRHGFADVQVSYDITHTGRSSARVTFNIDEGRPLLVDSLTFQGLDSVADRERLLRDLPLHTGGRFDRVWLDQTRDSLRRRLRNDGYPTADVLRSYDTYPDEHRVTVRFDALTGPWMRIGAINIVVDTARAQGEWIDPDRVRAVLGIRPGQVYREQSLEGVSRGLYLTEAFRQVNVSVDSASLVDDVDSLVTVDLTLIPGRAHAARASLGWGNLDCVRTQGSYTNYNFLGGLRRLDLTGRLSKVGVDKPFTALQGLCTPQMRNDPLSDTLNYYASATLSQAALFRIPAIPSITVYSERRSEFEAYLRETPIGVLATVQQGIDGRLPMTWSYQLDFGRTIAQPAFFCAVFNVCEDAARSRLEKLTRTAVLGWTGTRNRSNSFASPTQGSVVRLEVRHASAVIGSSPDVQFNRGVIDAAMYRPAFNGTFAVRFRAGAVLGSHLSFSGNPSFVPLQERLYGGGQNSVRGYSQNELGPALYVPDTFTVVPIAGDDTLAYFQASPQASRSRTVPTGGDNVVIANAELRLRSAIFPDLVQWALFVDAGQVWNRGRAGTGAGFRNIRVTPGAGVRVFTPIGPVRVDIGYNPYNPPPGPAYYNPVPAAGSLTSELRLICVSPGNTLRVRLAHTENGVLVPAHQIDAGDCPATYAPVRGGSFLSRLTFNFSIGQAF